MTRIRTITTGGLAGNIGGTNSHWQVRDPKHELAFEWTAATNDHPSLIELIRTGGEVAEAKLGAKVDFCGLDFGGPVNPVTGAVTLTNAKRFSDEVTQAQTAAVLGVPTTHVNDTAAAARRLAKLAELNLTVLTEADLQVIDGYAQYVLVEIGTGVGTGVFIRNQDVPEGTALSCEAQHILAENRMSHETNLCGSRAFTMHIGQIGQHLGKVPEEVTSAARSGEDLGPVVTAFIDANPHEPFSEHFVDRYARSLGRYLRIMQLAHQPNAIFLGGSVGRAKGFLERVTKADSFWGGFIGQHREVDVQRAERESMAIMRVNDLDLTVRGAYDTAVRRLVA